MEINIKTLANEIKMSIEDLMKECVSAGILKIKNNKITQLEKEILIKHLEKKHTNLNKNILIVKRKTRSTLNVFNSGGKNKSVSIEIRKRKPYLKNINYSKESNPVNQEANFQTLKFVNTFSELKQNSNSKDRTNDFNKKVFTQKKIKRTYSENTQKKQTNLINKFKIKNDVEHNLVISKKFKNTFNSNNISYDVNKKTIEQNKIKTKPLIKFNNHKLTDFVSLNHTAKRRNNHSENYRFTRNKGLKKNYQKKYNNFEKNINRENFKTTEFNEQTYKKNKKNNSLKQNFNKPLCVINRNIILSGSISVFDLANKMAIKSTEVIKKMMDLGYIVTINQIIDRDLAQLVAEEMGHKVIINSKNKLEDQIIKDRNLGDRILKLRPPIITIMGHVDHGKTSLLDKIRLTKIADKEAGGITQHIGAYTIVVNKKPITFLDTPGHSAFTAMRARGVQVTDIVILVIAADDGIKPQTIEAIQHAQAASVPILIAINKIDKLDSNPEKIKNELTKYNILPEEWGGSNIFVNVSAKSGKGIDDLLNAILIQSEIMELKAVSNGMASGLVLESFLDKGMGPTATVLVKEGKLNKGDIVLCGFEYGKIRIMKDDLGNEIKKAGPSIPVRILGLSGIPIAGDTMLVVRNEKKAREVAIFRQMKFKERKIEKQQELKSINIFDSVKNKKRSELNIIIKSDVHGSLEAISDAVLKLSNDEVTIKIVGKGVGGITETDVLLAMASNAIIIGFNVRSDASAKRIADLENIDLRNYSVIYQIIDEIKNCISSISSPKNKQKIVGCVKVRTIFKLPKLGIIAGCIVTEGFIKRNSLIHVLRNDIIIHKGELTSLRRFKEDVSEVRCGVECGVCIKNFNNIRVEDVIEVFKKVEI